MEDEGEFAGSVMNEEDVLDVSKARKPRKKRSTELEHLKMGMQAPEHDRRTTLKKCSCPTRS